MVLQLLIVFFVGPPKLRPAFSQSTLADLALALGTIRPQKTCMAVGPDHKVPPAPAGVAHRPLDDGSIDGLIREEPLVIDVGGQTVLTMRTPGNDEDLAVGFLLSEGVIASAAAVTDISWQAGDPESLRADTLTAHIDATTAKVEGRLTRTHEIRSSCGICGLAHPDALLDELPPLLPGVPRIRREQIDEWRRRFELLQPNFAATGAAHGAAIFSADGTIWALGEDVGRHNALDKAIGAAARAGHDLSLGIAMLSGRAGFDLVLKCLRVRLPVILSVSAASALSFDLCNAAGATLVGFVRPDRMTVYCSGGRLE